MFLTEEEKRMRDGAEGDAVAAAMDLLIRYGYALDAERLCDIRNVAGTMTQPSPVKARLVAEGGWDKAFAVINLDSDLDLTIPHDAGADLPAAARVRARLGGHRALPAANVDLQYDAESFYGRHGVNILATCTPYQVGNLPLRGEHCAWMESSAVIYANSVLGARTNCEGIASTGAASLTGKIPCWGNHREENRLGTHLISVEGLTVESFQDWGMLGYFAGGVAGEDHPVITGRHLPARPDRAEALRRGGGDVGRGRALPHSGDHAGGADGGGGVRAARRGARGGRLRAAERRADVRDAERDRLVHRRGLRPARLPARLGRPDPAGRRPARRQAAVAGTELWIMAPRALKVMADRSGYTEVIERAGGRVLADSCPAMSRAAPAGTKVFATDSAKQAHYLPAILGIEAWFGTLEECVSAAVTGRWNGGLR